MHPWVAALSQRWGLHPVFAERVLLWWVHARRLGLRLSITSGFRTSHQQARLYAGRGRSSVPVAKPGTSMHERGLAVDVAGSPGAIEFAGRLAEQFGLQWGGYFRRPDPIHIEWRRSR